MNQDDYNSDGKNIVPCPICLNVHCPSKEGGKCPEEDEFARSMTHYSSNEEVEKEFDERFPLSFFATEDWEYDFKDSPSEFQFRSWQEKQTNIAKTKREMLIAHISQTRLSDLDAIIEKVKETEIDVLKNKKHWNEEGRMDGNWELGYDDAIHDVLSYLTSLKENKV